MLKAESIIKTQEARIEADSLININKDKEINLLHSLNQKLSENQYEFNITPYIITVLAGVLVGVVGTVYITK